MNKFKSVVLLSFLYVGSQGAFSSGLPPLPPPVDPLQSAIDQRLEMINRCKDYFGSSSGRSDVLAAWSQELEKLREHAIEKWKQLEIIAEQVSITLPPPPPKTEQVIAPSSSEPTTNRPSVFESTNPEERERGNKLINELINLCHDFGGGWYMLSYHNGIFDKFTEVADLIFGQTLTKMADLEGLKEELMSLKKEYDDKENYYISQRKRAADTLKLVEENFMSSEEFGGEIRFVLGIILSEVLYLVRFHSKFSTEVAKEAGEIAELTKKITETANKGTIMARASNLYNKLREYVDILYKGTFKESDDLSMDKVTRNKAYGIFMEEWDKALAAAGQKVLVREVPVPQLEGEPGPLPALLRTYHVVK